MTLWPQPCPTPGSASYSAVMTTCGPSSEPARARKAVGIPPTPVSRVTPCRASSSATLRTVRNS